MLRALILLAACLNGIAACHAAETKPESKQRTWEFVQSARAGSFDGTTLTFHDVSPRTIGFTDRPDRIVRAISTEMFVDAVWKQGADSFAADPPNAVLAFEVNGEILDAVIEIGQASYDGTTLTYEARPLSGNLPGSFDNPYMVIDPIITAL